MAGTPFFRRPFKYSFFNATLIIIGINVLVHVLSTFYPLLKAYLGLSPYGIFAGKYYWQFFTYMFAHQNWSHLLLNMLGLMFFGIPLERQLGSKEFLLFYILCGFISGVVSFLIYTFVSRYNILLLGASGAIYAVLFAYAVGFPHSRIYFWWVIPVPAPIAVLIFALISIFSEIFGSSNVAHLAHLFGFVAAWLYILIRMGINPIKVWRSK